MPGAHTVTAAANRQHSPDDLFRVRHVAVPSNQQVLTGVCVCVEPRAPPSRRHSPRLSHLSQ
eukprot:6190403-Prymnesium_polylepis.1